MTFRAGVGLLAIVAALALSGSGWAAVKTGQSPDCRRYCMSVKPREGPEGSVFTFKGHHWRPNRRLTATFGAYCRPGEACIAIAYFVRVRTGPRGGFSFRLRAGRERAGDDAKNIHSGGAPTFSQSVGERTVSRTPRYRVVLP